MVQVALGLFLSFMVTDWVYSEASLFFPKFEELCRTIYEEVRIPTHPEWDDVAIGPRMAALEEDVVAGLEQLTGPQALDYAMLKSEELDRGIRRALADSAIGDLLPVTFASDDPVSNKEFLSGEEIFIKRQS